MILWLTVGVCLSLIGPATAGEHAIRIESGVSQLFVDDFLVDTQAGLERTLHQPHKDNGGNVPVIELPEEGSLMAKGTILYDPRLKRYVMLTKGHGTRQMYRFTSPDGMDWSADLRDGVPQPVSLDRTHPDTGKLEGYAGMHSFYYDERDQAHPYKGWIFFGNWGDELEGVYFVRSHDGKQWERVRMVLNGYAGPGDPSCREIRQDGRVVYGAGDVTLFYHDRQQNRFLGIFKFFTMDRVGPGNALRSRAYMFLDRLDRPFDLREIGEVALLPPAARVNGDKPDDEYYASTAWRYGSLWLGGLQVWHRGGDYPYSAAGCAFLKLVVSRDGLHWKKVRLVNDGGVPEVFIPNGPEGGNDGRNDGGYMSEFSQGPLRIGDELIYYYGCSSYGKNHPPEKHITGGGIFRARLRVDGFVSVDAGTLTTRPLAFRGDRLTANAVGPVTVEVLDGDGQRLAAATAEGDSLKHKIDFSGKTLGAVAADRAVRLRWTVGRGARLYSFIIH